MDWIRIDVLAAEKNLGWTDAKVKKVVSHMVRVNFCKMQKLVNWMSRVVDTNISCRHGVNFEVGLKLIFTVDGDDSDLTCGIHSNTAGGSHQRKVKSQLNRQINRDHLPYIVGGHLT